MTASVDALGHLHASLAAVFQEILSVREEPLVVGGEVVMKDGEPVMRKVYPSAAEMAAVAAFLKNNSITAVAGNESKLDELRELMAKRRAGKGTPVAAKPELPDALAVMPNPNTPWQ